MSRKGTVLMSASEERLEKLIEMRIEKGADKDKIDKRIWDLFGEQWAIMFTDLSGFSRRVADYGIVHFLQTIYESNRLLIPVIEEFDGILLKQEGDSFLVVFRNVNKAVRSAIAMQQVLKDYNKNKADVDKVLLCLGLGYGPVLKIGDSDVFGAEVNAASKLGEDTADPWEILVTQNVKKHATEVPNISYKEIPDTPPGAEQAFQLIYPL